MSALLPDQGSSQFALALDGQETRDFLLELANARVILKLAGFPLKPEIKHLFLRVIDGLDEFGRGPPSAVTVLVDKQDIVRYLYLGATSGDVLDGAGLMSALECQGFYLPPAPSVDFCRPV